MNKIETWETLELLSKIQQLQLTDSKHDISITTFQDKDGLWFCGNTFINKNVVYFECYNHRSYEDNLENITDFIGKCNNDL